MTHIAVQEALNGNVFDWMEHVSDAQHEGKGRVRVSASSPLSRGRTGDGLAMYV
jgi:hypothetical protein